uniref:N-acetyltransferase domain-containing protein n=2 Tax=Spongospora subterranea TaxID=70186 RepID=A0A0H5RLT0_9EUKA|eukprot:CRZ09684.1 hypothetical protein [Spongospora subterranea]
MEFITYTNEDQLPLLQRLIETDLSEPYSVFTYRYFLNAWPYLCILAMDEGVCVATIVGKHDITKKGVRRGYIAMLVVDKHYRRKGLGSKLINMIIERMAEANCAQVVLETEVTNTSAVRLYENLGFVKDKRLHRYYMNGVDAFRLKLWMSTIELPDTQC